MGGSVAHAEAIETATTVLVLATDEGPHVDDVCGSLLGVDDPDEVGVLYVTFTQSPERRIEGWNAVHEDSPARIAVVETGPSRVSSAAGGGPTTTDDGVVTRTVTHPENLTQLGVAITESVNDLDGLRPVLCVHSLTALLQYADRAHVFRFLSVLRDYLAAADGVAHFHLNPDAHDTKTVATMRELFDVVLDVDEGGSTDAH